jgi:site-specific recombinase XerD
MTLAALHARFLQHCAVEKRLRPMTIKSYRSDFGLFLVFLRRRRRPSRTLSPPGRGQGEGRAPTLRTFTTAVIRDYQAHMAARSWSTNTVRRRLVELNRFAGWLVERRYLRRSPMIGVSVPRRERRLPRVLDWSQVEQIVAGERKPRDRAILALLAYGGLRRGEMMAADVGDYSPAAPSLMVHGKGNKDRVVPLHPTAQAALDAYLATRRGLTLEHPLFVSWRGRITKQVVVLLCKRVSRRIGRRLHPHLFRHTFATELLNRRADLRVIQHLLGHESLATTEIYTHVSPERQREAVELLGVLPGGR